MSKRRRLRGNSLPPTRWSGLTVLESTHGLYTRCVKLLAESARTEEARHACKPVFGFQELWVRMDADACERAGRSPVLLLNLNFDVADWWDPLRLANPTVRAGAPTPLFAAEKAAPLIREILTEARGVARAQPGTARLVFGMASSVCTAVAGLSASDIERIASDHARELRPRWDTSPAFWKQLLEAAVGGDARVSAKVHLHCIQLLGIGLAWRSG